MEKSDAKKYNRIKLVISFTGIAVSLIFWILLVSTPLNRLLAGLAESWASLPLLQFYIFAIILGAIGMILNFPLSLYSGYFLEHRFSLTEQSFFSWAFEQVKGILVGLVLGGILLSIFYLLLTHYPQSWWFWMWVIILVFSVLLSRLAPVLIFPLFYKFTPLDNPDLKEKIYKLGRQWNLNVKGIFQFNLSKTTRKANAAFTGLGKTKRVILGDTLLNNFDDDEIETVFAHEIGHFVHKHLLKGIVLNSLLSLAGMYLVFIIYSRINASLGLMPAQLEALPYLGLLFLLYGFLTGPIGNYVSRRFEYQADSFAVSATGKPEIFQNSLKKLSQLNLADEEPHPLVEFLFYSHPSISHRIEKIAGVNK